MPHERKLIYSNGRDGRALAINPEMIYLVQAGEALNESEILYITNSGIAQFFVKETHSAFCRKWLAALNGLSPAEITN